MPRSLSSYRVPYPRATPGLIIALELLDDGTVGVLERVHHLLSEEPERSEIVFREDFADDMQRVFALASELLQIAGPRTEAGDLLPKL